MLFLSVNAAPQLLARVSAPGEAYTDRLLCRAERQRHSACVRVILPHADSSLGLDPQLRVIRGKVALDHIFSDANLEVILAVPCRLLRNDCRGIDLVRNDALGATAIKGYFDGGAAGAPRRDRDRTLETRGETHKIGKRPG